MNTQLDGKPVQVQMGWDTPMKWYYLVISPLRDDGRLDDAIYSNLDEKDPRSKTLQYYIDVCESKGIVVPNAMVAGVEDDKRLGRMNHRIEY